MSSLPQDEFQSLLAALHRGGGQGTGSPRASKQRYAARAAAAASVCQDMHDLHPAPAASRGALPSTQVPGMRPAGRLGPRRQTQAQGVCRVSAAVVSRATATESTPAIQDAGAREAAGKAHPAAQRPSHDFAARHAGGQEAECVALGIGNAGGHGALSATALACQTRLVSL